MEEPGRAGSAEAAAGLAAGRGAARALSRRARSGAEAGEAGTAGRGVLQRAGAGRGAPPPAAGSPGTLSAARTPSQAHARRYPPLLPAALLIPVHGAEDGSPPLRT